MRGGKWELEAQKRGRSKDCGKAVRREKYEDVKVKNKKAPQNDSFAKCEELTGCVKAWEADGNIGK